MHTSHGGPRPSWWRGRAGHNGGQHERRRTRALAAGGEAAFGRAAGGPGGPSTGARGGRARGGRPGGPGRHPGGRPRGRARHPGDRRGGRSVTSLVVVLRVCVLPYIVTDDN